MNRSRSTGFLFFLYISYPAIFINQVFFVRVILISVNWPLLFSSISQAWLTIVAQVVLMSVDIIADCPYFEHKKIGHRGQKTEDR